MFRALHGIVQAVQFPLVIAAVGDVWSVYVLSGLPPSRDGRTLTHDLLLLGGCAGGLTAGGSVVLMRDALPRRATAWAAGPAFAIAVGSAWAMGPPTLTLAVSVAFLWVARIVLARRWPAGASLLAGVIHAASAQLSCRPTPLGIWASAWLLVHHALLAGGLARLTGRRDGPSWAGMLAVCALAPVAALVWVATAQTVLLGMDQRMSVDLLAPLVAAGAVAALGIWIALGPRVGSRSSRAAILGTVGTGWTLVYQMAFQSAAGNLLGVLIMTFVLALVAAAAQMLLALQRLGGAAPPPR